MSESFGFGPHNAVTMDKVTREQVLPRWQKDFEEFGDAARELLAAVQGPGISTLEDLVERVRASGFTSEDQNQYKIFSVSPFTDQYFTKSRDAIDVGSGKVPLKEFVLNLTQRIQARITENDRIVAEISRQRMRNVHLSPGEEGVFQIPNTYGPRHKGEEDLKQAA